MKISKWKKFNDWYNRTAPEDFTLNLLGAIFWAVVIGVGFGMVVLYG